MEKVALTITLSLFIIIVSLCEIIKKKGSSPIIEIASTSNSTGEKKIFSLTIPNLIWLALGIAILSYEIIKLTK